MEKSSWIIQEAQMQSQVSFQGRGTGRLDTRRGGDSVKPKAEMAVMAAMSRGKPAGH